MSKIEEKGLKKSGVSRRDFLKISGTVTVGLGIAGFTNILWTKDGQAAIEVSGGYLLVDVKKCQGCQLLHPVRKEDAVQVVHFVLNHAGSVSAGLERKARALRCQRLHTNPLKARHPPPDVGNTQTPLPVRNHFFRGFSACCPGVLFAPYSTWGA